VRGAACHCEEACRSSVGVSALASRPVERDKRRARAVSSAGRAPALHAGCRRFESVTAHHPASRWRASQDFHRRKARSRMPSEALAEEGEKIIPTRGPFNTDRCVSGSRIECDSDAPDQTASLSSLDARKATFLLALILIGSPVAGLRPMRAARLRT
jgi:hypothetical protein